MNGCHRSVKANKAEKWQKREHALRIIVAFSAKCFENITLMVYYLVYMLVCNEKK